MSDREPLAPEQMARLAEARVAHRKVTRPARVAAFNGWTLGIFGGISVAWGLVAGLGGVVVGAALLAIAWNELRGAKRIRALDPEGATILGWNQLLLGAVIAAYCVWVIYGATPDPAMRELEEMSGISADLLSGLTSLIYGGVAVVVGLVQALLARYHFKAKARIHAFRDATPPWVLELL